MPAPKALAPRPAVPATAPGAATARRQAKPGRAGPEPQPSNTAVAAVLASGRGPAAPAPFPVRPPSAAQDMFGNGAVAAAGQDRTGPAGPAGAGPVSPGPVRPAPTAAGGVRGGPARPGPDADPRFARLKTDVRHKQRALAASHPPPRTEAAAAQGAARPPRDDAQAQGKTANAEKMNEAQPKEFDKDAFIRAVEKAIADKAPKNLDEADRFADSGKADEVRTEVHGRVGEGTSDSARQIATTTAAPPDTSAAVPKPVVPMTADRPPGAPGAPDAADAVPDRLPPSATDLSAGPAEVDRRMAQAQVTEAQLQRSNEPAFTGALGEKKAAEHHSETAPGRMRGHEERQLRAATARAQRLGTAAMGAMGAQRTLTGQRVDTGKTGARDRDEEKRARVTALLQGVFDTMQKDVQGILHGLDKLVDDRFGRGEKQAREAFTTEHKRRMEEYKDRRYSGAMGKLRWVRDLFAGLPAEADTIFEEARGHYVRRMRQVVSDVATTIGAELNRAKRRIARGRLEMRAAVDRLPAELRSLGREAAAEFTDRFDQLTQSVDDKGTQLVDTLATKYTEALKSVDDEIAAEKEQNRGLAAKAVDAVRSVIDTIIELKNLLLAVLAKAAQAVLLIIKDPIGFLRNLVTAVGAGLRQFLRNIGQHLRQGIMAWLLGKAGEAGLELPATFDTQGVVRMVAGLLGLTWQNIRARITRKVPEQAVAAAESAVPLVAEVRRRGVAGMWEDLRTRVGDLRKELLDKVISYVTPTVVVAGITWVISLLNPASAFVRAVKLIIDIVRFVVAQARQIIDFVNAVLDAVVAIARGGSGGVPDLIEKALARSVPVLLGFLASLLGLGGIAAKVKQIVQALAKPVNRAVDRVVGKIVGLVKKVWDRLKSRFGKKKPKPGSKSRPERPGRRRGRRPDRRGPKRTGRRGPGKKGKGRRPDKRSAAAKKRALDAALLEATALIEAKSATVKSVRRGLPAIRKRHGLTRIKLVRETKEKYHIDLEINPRARTRPEDLAERFPYRIEQIAPTSGAIKITRLARVIRNLPRITVPMMQKGKDPTTGFVVNMAATPGEVKADVAARYIDHAWKDSEGNSAQGIGLTRTAVVIGINTFERLDAKSAAGGGKAGIFAAFDRIRPKAGQLLGVFGFLWTPRWMHTGDKREVALGEVRHAYAQLGHAEQQAVVAANESGWRDGKLPYGAFRQEVLSHTFTKQAVNILRNSNTQVHIVSQDADTSVAAISGAGVLHAYQKVLASMEKHPLLVIGGYHFEGFKWGEHDDPRTRQLTLLSNRLDRTVRDAVATRFPKMLYPTEPNMLIKAWDDKQPGGIFQRSRASGLIAVEQQLYGLRSAEGRTLRMRLTELFAHKFRVVHAPEASTSTSPVPEIEDRGLTVRPKAVELAAVGKKREKGGKIVDIRVSHRAYAVILQTQSYANANALAREFFYANRGLDERVARTLRDKIFVHVENVVMLMSDDPRLTERSAGVQAELRRLATSVKDELRTAGRAGDKDAERALKEAHIITKKIVSALTAPQLAEFWTSLHKELDDVMKAAASRDGGAPR